MLGTILLGIDLFLAFACSILLVLSIISDLVTTSNITAYSEDLVKQLHTNSGFRFVLAFLASLFWTLFIIL